MIGRRTALILLLTAMWMAIGAAPAMADPPGPTDYQTTVIGIDPPGIDVKVEIIGGDSFVRLTSTTGEVIEVIGYRGEPYLRFLPGGIVEENQSSPTTYLNLDRYAEADVPPGATPEATPVWKQVADDGSYAWHDHRAHWMNEARPVGSGPGDVILEGVIPLVIGDTEVDLRVQSVWQDAPSPIPAIVGAVLGVGLVVALVGARAKALAVAITVIAVAAATVGTTAYLSVPAETGPAWSLWTPPAVALTLAAAALIPGAAVQWLRSRAATLVLLSGIVLVVWGVIHRDWLSAAILPTSLPFWLDRIVTAFALTAGAGIIALAVRATIDPPADASVSPPSGE